MTVFYGTNMAYLHSTLLTPPVVSQAATVRTFVETITLAAQATTDTIEFAVVPKGAKVLGFLVTTTATLGSSTIAFGITGTVAKYKAAATFTTTDTPTWFGKAAALNTRLSADETLIITIAAADLPAAGTLTITTFYAHD